MLYQERTRHQDTNQQTDILVQATRITGGKEITHTSKGGTTRGLFERRGKFLLRPLNNVFFLHTLPRYFYSRRVNSDPNFGILSIRTVVAEKFSEHKITVSETETIMNV